jgi:hypothetical protein
VQADWTYQEAIVTSKDAELQAAAEARAVPASTLARGWIMQRLVAERGAPSDTAAMFDRLENDVRLLRKLVDSTAK